MDVLLDTGKDFQLEGTPWVPEVNEDPWGHYSRTRTGQRNI